MGTLKFHESSSALAEIPNEKIKVVANKRMVKSIVARQEWYTLPKAVAGFLDRVTLANFGRPIVRGRETRAQRADSIGNEPSWEVHRHLSGLSGFASLTWPPNGGLNVGSIRLLIAGTFFTLSQVFGATTSRFRASARIGPRPLPR